jgi:VanZ family protein
LPINYLRVLPFLVVLAVILFSGLRPEPVPQVFDQQDKLHHMLGFAALIFTLRLAFPQWRVFWCIALSLGAATLIELGQSLLPNRQASLGDMLANTLGVFLGWGCSHLAYLWYLRRIGVTTDPEAGESAERIESSARP